MDASDAAEALLQKLVLDYDIFEDEDRGNLLEFDVVIGPHASATAVIELNKETPTAVESGKHNQIF